MKQGENLIVVGENQFDKKAVIRSSGFFWDGQNKQWYLPLNQAA